MYMLIKQPTLAVERKKEKREEGYKGLHSGLTIAGLTITVVHKGSDIKNIEGTLHRVLYV